MVACIKQGESQASASHNNGLPESFIHQWFRDEEKLHDFVDKVKSHWLEEKKKDKNFTRDKQFDKAVFTWFVKERQTGTLNSSTVLSI